MSDTNLNPDAYPLKPYTAHRILEDAIRMHYTYYMQLALPDPLRFDLQRNLRELIIELFFQIIKRHKDLFRKEEADLFVDTFFEQFEFIEECIAINAKGKGVGFSNKYIDEAYSWMSEVAVPVLMAGYFHKYSWPPDYSQSTELWKTREKYRELRQKRKDYNKVYYHKKAEVKRLETGLLPHYFVCNCGKKHEASVVNKGYKCSACFRALASRHMEKVAGFPDDEVRLPPE